MKAEQAIFTSISRRGKAGYHLVAKSDGLTPGESAAIEAWAPSHGGLILDPKNRSSVNFQQLSSGRYALSRTLEGRLEYSGRGGRQLYTHFLIFEADVLKKSEYQPFSIYRDAMAQGIFFYKSDPGPILPRVELSNLHFRPEAESWEWLVREFGRVQFESLVFQLEAERSLTLAYQGDRALLAEALLSRIEPEKILRTSFATNLQPSTLRRVILQLVAT